MTVYVLYAEYQSGEALASVEGVYLTEEGATAAKQAEIDGAHVLGWIVWGEPTEGDEQDQVDWTVTYHVEAFEVQP